MRQDIQSLIPDALKLIGTKNKLKDIQPAGWVVDSVPSTGAVIYHISAVEKDQPNGPIYSVVIDDQAKPGEFAPLDGMRVKVREYLSPIADAYAATDLALVRAGAMTTAELFAWEIPAVLVPLPTAAADHQSVNARTLAAAGAAIDLPQAQLTTERLDATLGALVSDPAAMRRLRDGARARARPHAAETIARRILALMERTRRR